MKLHEKEFYDYKTAPVVGDNVIDLHKTGMSYYDDFLSNDSKIINYLKDKKNLKGDIVLMSPKEYFEECAEYGFPGGRRSYHELISQRRRDTKTLTHLENVLKIYKKRFPMPVLNKADNAQEGLHRMMVVGDLFGWDHKVPVLVVDYEDKQLAFEVSKKQRIQRIEYNIKKAVHETLLYKFSNIEELKQQLQWELDKQFDYNGDDISVPVDFDLTTVDDSFVISIGAAKYEFDYDDVQFVNPSEDNIDTDDIDFDDIEDFLVRHFGNNWRKEHPDLKDTFGIK